VRAFVNGCFENNSLLGAAASVKTLSQRTRTMAKQYAQHSLRTANRASSTLARSRSRSPATGASAIAPRIALCSRRTTTDYSNARSSK